MEMEGLTNGSTLITSDLFSGAMAKFQVSRLREVSQIQWCSGGVS